MQLTGNFNGRGLLLSCCLHVYHNNLEQLQIMTLDIFFCITLDILLLSFAVGKKIIPNVQERRQHKRIMKRVSQRKKKKRWRSCIIYLLYLIICLVLVSLFLSIYFSLLSFVIFFGCEIFVYRVKIKGASAFNFMYIT